MADSCRGKRRECNLSDDYIGTIPDEWIDKYNIVQEDFFVGHTISDKTLNGDIVNILEKQIKENNKKISEILENDKTLKTLKMISEYIAVEEWMKLGYTKEEAEKLEVLSKIYI